VAFWEKRMTEEKVEEMLEEHAEALKIYDQEISGLKKRNVELEDKLERQLTDHKQDMVNLTILVRTLYMSFAEESGRAMHPHQTEIVKLLNGLHSRLGINLP
jgi:hypothetical protein